MATKPAQICQLQKGKLVDTQKGFVDTFNWAVQSIANLKGGENCDVTWPTDDHPTIDCTAKEGEGGEGGEGENAPAIDDIQRAFIDGGSRRREVLSCTYNNGTTKSVPYDIRLSGANGNGLGWSDSSRWLLSAAPDTNLSVTFSQAGDDGIAINLGVYYV